MSLRIIKPRPGHRGVEVQKITGLSQAELEVIGNRIAKDIMSIVDLVDGQGRIVKRVVAK